MSYDLFATVVSIYPFPLGDDNNKPGIPFRVNMPGGSKDKPSVLHVPMVYQARYVLDGVTTTIPLMPDKFAESIVNDYCNNIVHANSEAKPGLFWVEGKKTPEQILVECKNEIELAYRRQLQYFAILVRRADEAYSKTRNPREVSDLQRFACKELKLNREWMVTTEHLQKVTDCPSCTEKVPANAAVCPKCKCIIDEKKYKELKFAG